MKLKRLWLIPLLAGLLAMPTAAQEPEGSLTIRLSEPGQKEGVRFELDQCADIVDGVYVLKDAYRQSGVDLNGIETAAQMEEAAEKLAQTDPQAPREIRTDSSGQAKADVEAGVWLVRMTDGGSYGWIAPFLTAVPSWDSLVQEMTWNTVAEPKRVPFPVLRIRKVDEAGQPITGSDFAFEMEQNGSCIPGETDPATGTVTFRLSWGPAVIRETQAPNGYRKSSRTVQVDTGAAVTVDGEVISPVDGVIEVDFENRRTTVSTPTAVGTKAALAAAAGLAAAVGIVFLVRIERRKKR